MGSMFFDWNSLISLNFSNFNTSCVNIRSSMLCICSSLISLVLSIFNTSSVKLTTGIFYYCRALILLDLSSYFNYSTSNLFDAKCNLKKIINSNV